MDTETEPAEPSDAEAHDEGHDEANDEDDASDEHAARDVERLGEALAALDDDALRLGLAAMSAQSRQELATQLNLPAAASHLGDALPSLVRRKLSAATPERQHAVASALTERVNSETIAALGDRSDDPSRDDLLEVLPSIMEEHDTELVTLMLATYAASEAPCRAAMRDLLETDERFAIGEPVPVSDALPTFGVVARSRDDDDDPERAAVREQRKAAKTARRAASTHEREARATAEQKRRAAAHRAKRHK